MRPLGFIQMPPHRRVIFRIDTRDILFTRAGQRFLHINEPSGARFGIHIREQTIVMPDKIHGVVRAMVQHQPVEA